MEIFKASVFRLLVILCCILTLSACVAAYNPVLEGYQGPTAILNDSFKRSGRGSGEFFYLSKVNGKAVFNAKERTMNAGQGDGFIMTHTGYSRQIPTNPLRIILVGQVLRNAPISYTFNSGDNYFIKGEIDFTPDANEHYLVKGKLGKEYSAVWIANLDGKQVSDALVLEGDPEKNKVKVVSLTNAPISVSVTSEPERGNKENRIRDFLLEPYFGLSEKSVTKILGEPDNIYIDRSKNLFRPKPALTYFHYKDIGTIAFVGATKGRNGYLIDVFVVSEEERVAFIDIVKNSGGVNTQRLGKKYYEIGVYDKAYLDVLAAKIWDNRLSDDSRMIDGISWYCKIIGKGQTARYKKFLEDLTSDDQVSWKLRRHCKGALRSVNQYKVDITNQYLVK